MALQNTRIVIPDCQWMFGSDYELVGIPRVLEIMNQISNVTGEDVLLFQESLEISFEVEVVHGLDCVNNVGWVMEWVVLCVPLLYFITVVHQCLNLNLQWLQDVIQIEYLEYDE